MLSLRGHRKKYLTHYLTCLYFPFWNTYQQCLALSVKNMILPTGHLFFWIELKAITAVELLVLVVLIKKAFMGSYRLIYQMMLGRVVHPTAERYGSTN